MRETPDARGMLTLSKGPSETAMYSSGKIAMDWLVAVWANRANGRM